MGNGEKIALVDMAVYRSLYHTSNNHDWWCNSSGSSVAWYNIMREGIVINYNENPN